jgi:hypothetical protein
MLFMATALALKEPYIASLPSADIDLVYYGIYEGAPSAAAKPQRLIILNMRFLSSNNTGPVTPAKTVDVSQIVGKRAKVTRLSGPGSDATSGATFASQSYDSGKAKGKKVVEKFGSVVSLRSSEAVIVEGF